MDGSLDYNLNVKWRIPNSKKRTLSVDSVLIISAVQLINACKYGL